MNKDITIIICCYNAEEKLNKVLDKIYVQQELEKYVYEIIVVDNHSTDSTKEVVFKYSKEKKSPSIKYIYEARAGLSNARKAGVDACVTKWIAFLDDDNLIAPDWITKIVQYKNSNKEIGAFNGAVVPYISSEIDEEEKECLRASLKALACTHYNKEELSKKPKTPFRNPIGAGMVILADPLKELSDRGWLSSNGRTKDKLTSGEDTEMTEYVKKCGYKFGFCADAILYHDLGRKRLEKQYLKKLWYEMGQGVSIAGRNYSKVMRKAYLGLLYIRLIEYRLQNKTKYAFYRIYIKGYRDAERRK